MNSDEARQWEEEEPPPRIDLDEMSLAPLHCSDDMATLSVNELAATDLMSRVYVASRLVQPSPSYILYLVCVCGTDQHHKAGSDNARATTCTQRFGLGLPCLLLLMNN